MPAKPSILSFCPTLLCGLTLAAMVLAGLARGDDLADGPATNATPASFQLRAAAQVDGGGVFLDQLVEPAPGLPRLRLCDAPLWGKPLVLKQAELTELAKAAGFFQTPTNCSGASMVRISRRARALTEKEALALLSQLLQKEYVKDRGELELRLAQPLVSITIPDEPFSVKISDLPTSGVSSAFIVRFEIETAHGEAVGSWQAALQAKVWRDIWVAASALKRGDSVRGADISRQRRDVLLCWEPLAEFTPDDSSLEFIGPVQAGTPIWARLIRPRAVVHRGQSLAAMVQDGGLQIILKVEALEDGAAGQIIRIRNPISQRDLRGKVVDEQNVLVSM